MVKKRYFFSVIEEGIQNTRQLLRPAEIRPGGKGNDAQEEEVLFFCD